MISHLHFDPTFANAVNEQVLAAKAKKDTKVITSVSLKITMLYQVFYEIVLYRSLSKVKLLVGFILN